MISPWFSRDLLEISHDNDDKPNSNINKRADSSNDKKINNELKQTAKFWEPGNPDYDRVNKKGNKT